MSADRVGIGSRVLVRFLAPEPGDPEVYELCDLDCATGSVFGVITPDSPVGLALDGAVPGEVVTYLTPYGEEGAVKVLEILEEAAEWRGVAPNAAMEDRRGA